MKNYKDANFILTIADKSLQGVFCLLSNTENFPFPELYITPQA
jgi:hypothetical protein